NISYLPPANENSLAGNPNALFIDLENKTKSLMDKKPSLISNENLHFHESDPTNVQVAGNDKFYINPSEYILPKRKLTQFPVFKNGPRIVKLTPLNNPLNRSVKRLMDIVFATLITIFVLSWLIPLVALLIKIDSKGSIFFLQKRKKKNGEIFTCLKFRTMF